MIIICKIFKDRSEYNIFSSPTFRLRKTLFSNLMNLVVSCPDMRVTYIYPYIMSRI